jgi:hypothetical protein
MTVEAGELRRKAEACRRLAAIGATEQRRAEWLRRADDWEKLAAHAAQQAYIGVRKRRVRRMEALWQSISGT